MRPPQVGPDHLRRLTRQLAEPITTRPQRVWCRAPVSIGRRYGGAVTKRWVRYVVPVMVEVDCDEDRVLRLVALPGEAREDRDDCGHFLFYDENFVRQRSDGPIENHALWVANPPNGRMLPGSPQDWPDIREWDDDFDIEADEDGVCEMDRYAEIHPYRFPGDNDLW